MPDMPSLNEIQETFSLLAEWEDRYAYLIDLGRKLDHFPDDCKTDANLVRGCTSRVWMILDEQEGRLHIRADSDAHIVKGLIALVIATYNGQSVADITNIDMQAIFKNLGLAEHLSPNRRNGFFAMVEKIKAQTVGV